ncbi:MAG: signal peptidase II [bacterium]|nr:signal peptidase II [bacterium]
MTSSGDNRWFWGPFSRLGYLWAVLSFAIDQFHKWWMLNITGIREGDTIVISPFFDLILIWNRGVSYGLFQQESMAGRLALAAFSLIAVIALAVWLAQPNQTSLTATSVGLIMGGALGNALDRLIRPGVADFFSLHAFGYNWYIFNIADIAIVAGVVGLLYDAIFVSPKTASKSSQD